MDGPRKLGERLLGEIEGEGLVELLSSLHDLSLPRPQNTRSVFGIHELDALLPQPAPPPPIPHPTEPEPEKNEHDPEPWILDPILPRTHAPTTTTIPPKPPRTILELISPPYTHHPSPSGKSSLIYLIITLATLPPTLLNIPLNGKNAAIILLDPLSHFNAPRLAEIMLHHLTTVLTTAGQDIRSPPTKNAVQSCIHNALLHVHVFRPTTWSALLHTLQTLPTYLFDGQRHVSMGRCVGGVVVEHVDALALTSPITTTSLQTTNPLTTHLTSLLTSLPTSPIIITSYSTSPTTTTTTSFRPTLPTSSPHSPQINVTRLAIRSVRVLPFAPCLSVDEAEADRAQRWDVVGRRRFEVWRVGAGGVGTEGFVFRVGRGVVVEKGEGEGVGG
ncbi:hypothetical protein P280DRAFT_534726 [Massarina eburnea CBS 473.64]|uniref:DNA recombination and repair protein Rad51-like C-terminal domain-containing protein n=1 Tax=Massarina eburnea CBS 473.64 TaxID=1395130 RepID=A0A6A6RNJ3_9PLEO|nr:hypothetical protein P280DRAFT_534726 [Massarina eburnea CBS 473.64]